MKKMKALVLSAGLVFTLSAIAGMRFFEVGPLAVLEPSFWDAVIFGTSADWKPSFTGWPTDMEPLW